MGEAWKRMIDLVQRVEAENINGENGREMRGPNGRERAIGGVVMKMGRGGVIVIESAIEMVERESCLIEGVSGIEIGRGRGGM